MVVLPAFDKRTLSSHNEIERAKPQGRLRNFLACADPGGP